MDKPDTLIELHRTVVEELAIAEFVPKPSVATPFATELAEGLAHIEVALSRVWFHEDGSGRVWSEAAGTPEADRERHFAMDLRLADHPADTGRPDSRLELTRIIGPLGLLVPAPTVPPAVCRGKTIPANVIPLPGRLTIHERLERIASTVDGHPGQNIVIEFAAQPSPVLTAMPPPGVDARIFGPGVQRAADGSVTLTGNDPRIVWELTREEQLCVVRSTAGQLLVNKEVLGGATQAEAEDAVLDTIATRLAEGAATEVATAGNLGTSVKSILPNKRDSQTGEEVPLPADQLGVPVGLECATDADAIEIDARVKAWTRSGTGEPGESLVFQLRTVEDLPDEHRLPDSVLALRERERVALSRAGWSILRSLRCGQLKALCLDPSDFDPAEGCRLRHGVDIVIGEHDATLTRFLASIEPWPQRPTEGLLHIDGRAEGGNALFDWRIEFKLDFSLERGEAPRNAVLGETPQRSATLEEIDAQIDALYAERCAGTRDRLEADAEIEKLLAQKKLGPTTIGVKPIVRNTFESSDSEPTITGILLGVVAGSVIAILTGGLGLGLGFSAGVVFSLFVAGVAIGLGGIELVEAFVADPRAAGEVAKFVNDKRDQTGEALRLDGFEPIHVELALLAGTQDAYALNVYLEEIGASMRVLWREPDAPKPEGDPDYVIQWVAGNMPADDRIWMLTVNDAVRYITRGRLALTVGAGDAPVHVATSSRGRRYLRTNPDAGVGNNLAKLPPLPH
jgi:hypothetical protein